MKTLMPCTPVCSFRFLIISPNCVTVLRIPLPSLIKFTTTFLHITFSVFFLATLPASVCSSVPWLQPQQSHSVLMLINQIVAHIWSPSAWTRWVMNLHSESVFQDYPSLPSETISEPFMNTVCILIIAWCQTYLLNNLGPILLYFCNNQ